MNLPLPNLALILAGKLLASVFHAWDALTAPFTTGDRIAAWGWLALAATFAWYVAYSYPHGGAA